MPTYNAGRLLLETVRSVLPYGIPIVVIVDGSTDGSDTLLEESIGEEPLLTLIRRESNKGKGAAVFTGLEHLKGAGISHALVMDSDGQHPEHCIPDFCKISRQEPEAIILGLPVFDEKVPRERLHGRKLSIGLAHFETYSKRIGDPLFGFRIFPVYPLLKVMSNTMWARHYDFDHEVLVKMVWMGVPVVNRCAPVRYVDKDAGGVSHFNYLRDNIRLVGLHIRLIPQMLIHLSAIIKGRSVPRSKWDEYDPSLDIAMREMPDREEPSQ